MTKKIEAIRGVQKYIKSITAVHTDDFFDS